MVVWLETSRRDAVVRVQDSGLGIDAQDLPHVFERFYRSDDARSGDGTGLGLAIARSIAEAHEGNISAQNSPEGGALFTLTLPLTSREAPASPEPGVSASGPVTTIRGT